MYLIKNELPYIWEGEGNFNTKNFKSRNYIFGLIKNSEVVALISVTRNHALLKVPTEDIIIQYLQEVIPAKTGSCRYSANEVLIDIKNHNIIIKSVKDLTFFEGLTNVRELEINLEKMTKDFPLHISK